MSLLQYVKNIIYKAKGFDNVRIPQAYDSFGILMPEASSSVQGIRPFPLPEDEHLFALLWNIHDGHLLSATILPTPYQFTKKQRANNTQHYCARHVFPYVGIIQIRFQVKTTKSTLSPSI